jgi:hypothetical protein
MRTLLSILCLAIGLAPVACKRSEDVSTTQPPAVSAPGQPVAPPQAKVTAIELGSAVTSDGRLAANAERTTFAPSDTIYVSVLTAEPPAGAELSARWTFEDGQLVNESREQLTSTGNAATEFHIAKPDGWPVGRYKVEIAMNGRPAGAREFEVR